MSFSILLNLLVIGALVITVAFTAVFGRRCERIGAAIYGGGIGLVFVSQLVGKLLFSNTYPSAVLVLGDLLTCLGFVALAAAYPAKLWPGAAAVAQYFVFVFSLSQLVEFPLSDAMLAHASNLSSLGVKITLIAGTCAARWAKPRRDEWEELAASLAALPPPTAPR